jgi:hypothetical protein
MDTASETLLRLADPAARPAVLTPDALLAVVTVAYALDPALVTVPATAVFDRFDLAVPLGSQVRAMAQIRRTGEPVPWEVSATWDTGTPPPPAADAVWAGSIVVRTATVTDTVVAVATAQLGHQAGGGELLSAGLRMSPPGQDPPPAPVVLPVVVAFLVADAATSPRELLRATPIARLGAASCTVVAAPSGAPARLVDRLVCWVVPAAVFDDPGWPGAADSGTPEQKRAARLRAARGWLAGQGVAVITTEGAA